MDTAQGVLSVALVKDGEAVSRHHEKMARGHAEALFPAIQAVLAKGGAGFGAVDALAVTIGPGTFTGLRVGLAAARGLAVATRLPVVGVTTLEALAEPVGASGDEVLLASFDARRNEAYWQAFGAMHTAPALSTIKEIAVWAVALEAPLRLVGTGAPLLAEALAEMGVAAREPDAPAQPDAVSVGRIAHKRLVEKGPEAFLAPPAPLYLRKADAKLPGGIELEEARP